MADDHDEVWARVRANRDAFRRDLPRLLADGLAGRWVVYHGEARRGHFATEDAALAAAAAAYGPATGFAVHHVTPDDADPIPLHKPGSAGAAVVAQQCRALEAERDALRDRVAGLEDELATARGDYHRACEATERMRGQLETVTSKLHAALEQAQRDVAGQLYAESERKGLEDRVQAAVGPARAVVEALAARPHGVHCNADVASWHRHEPCDRDECPGCAPCTCDLAEAQQLATEVVEKLGGV